MVTACMKGMTTLFDAVREMRKFRPLPVSAAEVPALGLHAAWWEELTRALHKMGLAQFRSAADMKSLVAKAEEMSSNLIVAQQQGRQSTEAERTLILSFLPVVDTFDLSYDAVVLLGQPEWKEQFDGFRATVTGLLEQMGLEHLPGEGEPFDPEVHEEMNSMSAAESAYAHLAPGTVMAVYQRGFRWKGALLRRAQVVTVR